MISSIQYIFKFYFKYVLYLLHSISDVTLNCAYAYVESYTTENDYLFLLHSSYPIYIFHYNCTVLFLYPLAVHSNKIILLYDNVNLSDDNVMANCVHFSFKIIFGISRP